MENREKKGGGREKPIWFVMHSEGEKQRKKETAIMDTTGVSFPPQFKVGVSEERIEGLVTFSWQPTVVGKKGGGTWKQDCVAITHRSKCRSVSAWLAG